MAPAMHISGSTHQPPSRFQVASATPVPARPPITYWPSAPMFQTLARKPIERPTAIMISGAALVPRSCHLPGSTRGSTKISQTAARPLKPSRVKTMAPTTMVRRTAISGVR